MIHESHSASLCHEFWPWPSLCSTGVAARAIGLVAVDAVVGTDLNGSDAGSAADFREVACAVADSGAADAVEEAVGFAAAHYGNSSSYLCQVR